MMIPITLVALLIMAVPCGAVAQVSFTRIMEGDLAQDTGLSTGCAWGDYDNDGYPDLVVTDGFGAPNHLYHNNGDGTFSRVREGPIANDPGDSSAAVWADYDNDGDLDLFVTSFDPPRDCFYRNEANGVFTKVTQGPWVTDSGAGVSAAWGDYDNDGLVDLFVGNSNNQNNYLYRNNGDGTIGRINTGPVISSDGSSHGCMWSDYDGDGDVDLFVACGHGEDEQQFLNNGDGSFTRVTTGHLVNSGGQGTGISCSDYDNDGYLDLFFANCGQDNFLFHNNGDGTFVQVTEGALVHDGGRSFGCAWADYDNDGDLDLFVANGPDPFGTNAPAEPGFLYRNDGGTNHWLLLHLVGIASNRSAIGAKVRILTTIQGESFWQLREVSGGGGYCSQNDLRVHFGLGDATTVESVRIEWPSGITQFLRDVAADQRLTVTEEDPTPNNTAAKTTPACPDFNGDEIVDSVDLGILVEHWQTDYLLCDIAPPPYGDGVVDVQDLIEVTEHLFEEVHPPGLIAYWKLDEVEGIVAADQAGTNNGTLVGDPLWQPGGGKVGGALRLDGTDDYVVTEFVLDPSQRPFSVFAWVQGGAPGQVILAQDKGANWLAAETSQGALATELKGVGRAGKPLTSSAIFTDGAWHRVGLVWDGANRILYLDGAEVARDTQAGLSGSTGNLFIGAGSTLDAGTFWSGLIDDVRIYNRAVQP
jgi:hypothetical protein